MPAKGPDTTWSLDREIVLSRGPDRDLARALLERGERTAVVTYLTDCARFWTGNEAVIDGWRSAIERGEPTLLDRPYDSDDT